ncbi:hypothetical protein SAMD00019534_087220 [Acytostelium subglobosum LB1]|uniref:hypothetical protein n=1 Tax=Acytostelium subglobosum LB1 TaxID=1410327 RepID=UPI000644CB5B|nr:hypothetical protein SAMD00019534_087220 [Acytostelium subglobosum LB1]GAM25547.1 hypothetical protein SAMD00019534_087220 [Acytostelium subglobosum LB1]|eukprot:XP_012751533.1 hypothetical protein SAMD00019534_087220 [Acytostelium subglobosum LB1]
MLSTEDSSASADVVSTNNTNSSPSTTIAIASVDEQQRPQQQQQSQLSQPQPQPQSQSLQQPLTHPQPQPQQQQQVHDYRKEFDSLFRSYAPLNKPPLEILKYNAFSGALIRSPLRGLAWRLFMGCLNVDNIENWHKDITKSRALYTQLLEQHYVDPRKTSVYDPLSIDENSPWNKYFKNMELQKTISMDIERTYQDLEFFQHQSTKEMMLRILFIYSMTNMTISYRQGMHELLAPILYLFHGEADKYNRQAPSYKDTHIADTLYDKTYLEHDTFTFFLALMKISAGWFGITSVTPPLAPAALPATATAKQQQQQNPLSMGIQKMDIRKEKEPEAKPVETVINEAVNKCQDINRLLRQKDPKLHEHLVSLDIEPQIFLLRWIRLLFGREFELEDVLTMWDSLFAYGQDLVLLDYVSISMLVYIRDQLLSKDNSGVLQRLFKYPAVEDIHMLIQQAFRIKDTKGPLVHSNTYRKSSKKRPQQTPPNNHTPQPVVLPGSETPNNNEPISVASPPLFTPFSALIGSGIRRTMSPLTGNKYATIGGSTPSSRQQQQHTSTPQPPAFVTAKPSAAAAVTNTSSSLYGDSLFSSSPAPSSKQPQKTTTTTTTTTTSTSTTSTATNEPQQTNTHNHQPDIFGVAKKGVESLGLLPTSVNPNGTPRTPSKSFINTEIRKLRRLHQYIGHSLGEIIPTLQTGFSENPELIKNDSLLLVVAQMKQLKDMLLGDIPIPEDMPSDDFETGEDIEDPLGGVRVTRE